MILIVDDEKEICNLLSAALTRAGHEVLVSIEGKEASSLFELHRDQIQLLISDVVMPGMDGISLGKQCRQLKPSLPVVYMSGYIKSAEQEAMEETGQFFLQKPIVIQELLPLIQKLIGKDDLK